MIAFWAVAGVMSAAAAVIILHRAAAASRAQLVDPTLGLYRRQLGEIDELAERGLLSDAERRGAHAEAARRLLAAADAGSAPWVAAGGRRPILIAAIAAPLAAAGLYLAVGDLGARDQPYVQRLAAWRDADPESLAPPQMAAVLRALAAERPRDPDTLRYLAMAEAASQDINAATVALRRAVAVAPERGDLWDMLGEALTAQADGAATPDAVAAFREGLKRNPRSMSARFHLARASIEAGDRESGVRMWRELLADMGPDDGRRRALQAAIYEAEHGRTPAAADDPTRAAIRGMVSGLAERLRVAPDDPPGWVRLVRSYAVLGDATARDAALATARVRYAGRADVLRDLDEAARAQPMTITAPRTAP
ncbi:c-type cytochrome biogenesis protein CcmI [Phenylobacterium sp.]|uniref:c-type cytochrome biogenesis protein CcmI n=1 Tax=Phenylobacterium sp. TaxID=1871053 RepID=UPI002736C233|nr:c-type cytochrome biogenesis protein CcmI [Phenylobacterium sp.]MDP3660015.1 c-type cytochrome biogenesis protein CcmI [Phenylobacterium sp.]